MPPEYNNYCIHIIDNSAGYKRDLQPDGKGWGAVMELEATEPVDVLRPHGLLFRQRFPTHGSNTGNTVVDKETGLVRKVPLWATGYKRAQLADNDVLWQTTDEIGDWSADRPWLNLWDYIGHLGGDAQPGSLPNDGRIDSDGKWIKGDWWAEDDRLLAARERGPNSFNHELDLIFTQSWKLGMNVMIDASARILKYSPYYWALAHYGKLTIDSGKDFGVEAPADSPDMIELQNEIGMSGGALPGVRLGRIHEGSWSNIPGKRLVFAHNQPMYDDLRDGITPFFTQKEWTDGGGWKQVNGDVGGWTERMHRIVASRVAAYAAHGDYAVFTMSAITRAGFKDVNDWIETYASQGA